MFWYKSCPKCRGDLFLANYLDGYEICCFQCGKQVSPRLLKRNAPPNLEQNRVDQLDTDRDLAAAV